jgi:hypothetical protein
MTCVGRLWLCHYRRVDPGRLQSVYVWLSGPLRAFGGGVLVAADGSGSLGEVCTCDTRMGLAGHVVL